MIHTNIYPSFQSIAAFRPPVFHTQQLSKPFISHAQRIFKYQYNIPLIQDSSNQLFSNKIIV